MKRISVVIPCFNAEKYIDMAISSIYEQNYPDIELIVVNDGSTDHSEEIILSWKNRFADKGYELKYLYQRNQGQAAATSLALKYVTGDYLTLLDADDYFLPGSFKKRADFLNTHPDYAGVRTNGWQIRQDDKKLFVSSESEKRETNYFDALFFSGAVNWAGSYMVRTEILFEFYPNRSIYPSRYGQNMQIILPVAYKRKFGFIDEPLMVYELHEGSHSQASSKVDRYEKETKNLYGYLDIYRYMIEHLIQDSSEKKRYENVIDSWQFRHECDRAKRNNKIDDLRYWYIKLCKTGHANLNDKIKYCESLAPIKALYYRVLRRLRSLF